MAIRHFFFPLAAYHSRRFDSIAVVGLPRTDFSGGRGLTADDE
jgi:hypothetical protein